MSCLKVSYSLQHTDCYDVSDLKVAMWGFPKMVVPNNRGFPTKNVHFGVFCVLGVPPFKETPMLLRHAFIKLSTG